MLPLGCNVLGGRGLARLYLSCQQTPCACLVAYTAAEVALGFALGFLESTKTCTAHGEVGECRHQTSWWQSETKHQNQLLWVLQGWMPTPLLCPHKCIGPEVSWLSSKPLPVLSACDHLVAESPFDSRHSILLFYW